MPTGRALRDSQRQDEPEASEELSTQDLASLNTPGHARGHPEELQLLPRLPKAQNKESFQTEVRTCPSSVVIFHPCFPVQEKAKILTEGYRPWQNLDPSLSTSLPIPATYLCFSDFLLAISEKPNTLLATGPLHRCHWAQTQTPLFGMLCWKAFP